jgi:beta-glucosidase
VTVDPRTLHEIYLPHFRRLVREARVGSVMSAYNKVNGHYCGENRQLLREILRDGWEFPGFVVSDWFFGTRSTEAAVEAGLDIEMPTAAYYGDALIQAVRGGAVSEAVVDGSVRRILRTKFCFDLDTDPPVADPSRVESQEHLDLALEVARKAIVLLKNEDGALPLGSSGTLAVVGALADRENLGDTGSSDVHPSEVVTPLEGFQGRTGVVAIPRDVLEPDDLAAIGQADAAVVVVGLTAEDEGEGVISAGDREALGLSDEHRQLVLAVAAACDRTVVVLEGGSAIAMDDWLDEVEAVLMAWYPGLQGGTAIADVVLGDVNPSGRLPIVFPRALGDLPAFVNDQDEVTYGYYHGYRHLDRNQTGPLFPFGFGLSYTTFGYERMAVERRGDVVGVEVDVTNTGDRAGDEVVQVYVSYEGSRIDRPLRELKGFARVHLEPGETRTVTIDVPVADLAFWDASAPGFVVEAIPHRIQAGPSSRELPLVDAVDIGEEIAIGR